MHVATFTKSDWKVNTGYSKIEVTANKRARTFTLRYYDEKGKVDSIMRTTQMSKDDFEAVECYTYFDWQHCEGCGFNLYIVK